GVAPAAGSALRLLRASSGLCVGGIWATACVTSPATVPDLSDKTALRTSGRTAAATAINGFIPTSPSARLGMIGSCMLGVGGLMTVGPASGGVGGLMTVGPASAGLGGLMTVATASSGICAATTAAPDAG